MRLARKAQMSLVMIVVIALALMFYAVSANWTKISAKKTQVTIAANIGAANLASQFASYGEYLLQTQMDNALVQIDYTGAWWKWIVGGILAVAAIVVSVIAPPAGPLVGYFAAFVIGLAVSAASFIFQGAQASLQQPGFTREWQKEMANIPTTAGRFAEQGIQAMLAGVINDGVSIYDRLDMDSDGRWYLPETGAGDPLAPKISRFAYYNTKRLLYLPPKVPFDALQDVLIDMQAKLGMSQAVTNPCPVDAVTGNPLIPQCDPCCQEPMARQSGVPDCPTDAAFVARCATASNPDCTPTNLNACFVYDPLYDTRGPVDPSLFMGTLGEDDTDPHTKVVNGQLYSEGSPFTGSVIGQPGEQTTMDGGVFRGSDATGKLFPMLWIFADTNTYVKDLWADGTAVENTSSACHWRAQDSTGDPACALEVAAVAPATLGQAFYRPSPTGVAYDQLSLAPPCTYGDCYVNMFKNTLDPLADLSLPTSNYDPRRIDAVPALKAFIPPVADDQCPADSAGQYWKKGSDRLSQTFYVATDYTPPADSTDPYYIPTTERIVTVSPIKDMDGASMNAACEGDSCVCDASGTVPERWRDDPIDRDVKNMYDFSSIAIKLVTVPDTSFQEMLNTTSTWSEPVLYLATHLDETTARLNIWNNDMNQWLAGDPTNYNYVGADLWCLPLQNDAGLTQKEKDYILGGVDPSTGAAPVWGSLTSVIRCLDYNSNNYDKFNACYNGCSPDGTSSACADLPRSLLPGFIADPTQIPGGNAGGYIEKQRGPCLWDPSCLTTTNLISCATPAIEDLTTFMNNMVLDQELYSKLNVGVFYSQLPLVDTGIYDRLMASDATVTLAEITTLNTDLVKAICPLPVITDVPRDACTAGTQGATPVAESPYMASLRQSRDLAKNQSDKFKKRTAYLTDLRGRVIAVRDVFLTAYQYLTSDMNVPTAAALLGKSEPPTDTIRDIIQWFKDHMGDKADNLGNDVIYGWFSKPAKGSTRAYGPLHLVRVQASAPGYRKELATTFPITAGGAQEVMKIDTDTNWNGNRRAYILNYGSRAGFVGARVIRYDEDQSSPMSFLSGLPIWQMVFQNPHPVDGTTDIQIIYDSCTKNHYTRVAGTGGSTYNPDQDSNTGDQAEGFIFDLPLGTGSVPPALATCSSYVQKLLKRGMVSETCAMYRPYCKGPADQRKHPEGTDCHYDLMFSPCK